MNALLSMEVASPTDLIDPITSIASMLGIVLETMLGIEPNKVSKNTTDMDPCGAIAPIDQANADKPGVVEYETDIGDSGIHHSIR